MAVDSPSKPSLINTNKLIRFSIHRFSFICLFISYHLGGCTVRPAKDLRPSAVADPDIRLRGEGEG